MQKGYKMREYPSYYLKPKKPIQAKKSFAEVQSALDTIQNLGGIIDEIEKHSVLNKKKIRRSKNERLLKMRLLLSEMRGKEEILNRLAVLTHHMGLLRKSLLMQDDRQMLASLQMFTKNTYAGLSGVIRDISILDKLIKEFDHHYSTYVRQEYESLDHKIHLEKGYAEAMKKLNACLEGKKTVALSIGRMFVDTGKALIHRERSRPDLENAHTQNHLP